MCADLDDFERLAHALQRRARALYRLATDDTLVLRRPTHHGVDNHEMRHDYGVLRDLQQAFDSRTPPTLDLSSSSSAHRRFVSAFNHSPRSASVIPCDGISATRSSMTTGRRHMTSNSLAVSRALRSGLVMTGNGSRSATAAQPVRLLSPRVIETRVPLRTPSRFGLPVANQINRRHFLSSSRPAAFDIVTLITQKRPIDLLRV